MLAHLLYSIVEAAARSARGSVAPMSVSTAVRHGCHRRLLTAAALENPMRLTGL